MSTKSDNASHFNEWDSASLFRKWSYTVANPMLKKGMEADLEFNDLMFIPNDSRSEYMVKNLKENYISSKKFLFLPRLMVAQFKTYYKKWIVIIFYTIFEGACRVLLPLFLIFLLRDLQNDNGDKCFIWAGVISFLSISQTLAHHVLFYYSMLLGWNWKNATTALIYDSLFQIDGSLMQTMRTGQMVNLISNDVFRFEEFTIFATFFWETSIEVTGIILILIYILNVPAALSGVGVTLFFIPLLLYCGKMFADIRGKTARSTDSRVRHIAEVIDGISSVKSYAWETPFFLLIRNFRKKEIRSIFSSQLLRSLNQGLTYSIPPIASLVTFSVYWATGNDLDIAKVFATISLLQVLKNSIGRQFTRSVETGSEAIASCYRIETFLELLYNDKDQLKEKVIEQLEHSNPNCIVEVKDGSFYYGSDETEDDPTISGINFSLNKGEILCVVGPVGSGKSTLISSILNELTMKKTKTSSNYLKKGASVAYCAQKPWIIAATVRSNICISRGSDTEDFKNPKSIEPELYIKAVESSLLVEDLKNWAAYDSTEIGERGVSISGGQKARVSLARAIYADADLYLLDDPLSAVDAHVGKSLMIDCIKGTLKEENKAVLLVTHQLQYLKHCDKVLVLNKDGSQMFYGYYHDLLKQEDVVNFLELSSSSSNSEEDDEDEVSVPIKKSNFNKKKLIGAISSKDFIFENDNEEEFEESKGSGLVISQEEKSTGNIGFKVYLNYFKSGGLLFALSIFLILLFSQGILMISDYWLRWWASSTFFDQNNSTNLWIYAILVFFCIIFGFLRAFLWFYFSIKASSSLHYKALWAMLHSPMSFFVANPSGRILNRFAKDQNLTDETLPIAYFNFLEIAIFSLASILLIVITVPWLVISFPFLLYFFYIFRKKYMSSTREIKRLEALTRSPIYADFSATLDGLVTLRAFKIQTKVTNKFYSQINDNGRAWFSFLMTSRWLGLRIDLESTLLMVAITFLCVGLRNTLDVGMIGFALSYTMSLNGLLQWAVRQSAEVETQMTSVERIASYGKLPAEPGYSSNYENVNHILSQGQIAAEKFVSDKAKENKKISDNCVGKVELVDLSASYRDDLDPVLKNLNINIPSGSKVGICGRTGSGKSTTLMTLLRLNLITNGDILIDNKSLLKMDLETARSMISIIPQEPHLFSGTIRFNLDPFSIYSDNQIWEALKDAHIYEKIHNIPQKLSYKVEESGKNFSVGERQLLSMARAILRGSKIILMDEVTASIDFITDRLIQDTIRTSHALKDATIITVAHRLRTIADSDLIVVIDAGNLAEFDSPKNLLENQTSIYRSLAVKSGEFDEIYRLAQN